MFDANRENLARIGLLENPLGAGGGVQCCQSFLRCRSTDSEYRQYYFRYKIVYNTEEDLDSLVPIYSGVFSASSRAAESCEVEYNTPDCDVGEKSHTSGKCIGNGQSEISFNWLVQSDIDIHFAFGCVIRFPQSIRGAARGMCAISCDGAVAGLMTSNRCVSPIILTAHALSSQPRPHWDRQRCAGAQVGRRHRQGKQTLCMIANACHIHAMCSQ